MEAKRLTENCHMLIDSHKNRLALVWNIGGSFVKSGSDNIYSSIEEISKEYGENITYTELTDFVEVVTEIDGFPVKHDATFNVTTKNENIIYTSRQGSDVYFCAGWWIIATDSVLRVTLSPKVSTISDTSVGPFKDKFDCQAELNRLNKLRVAGNE